MSKYDHLDREALLRLLQRRDAERQLGLVWEREEIDLDESLNDDYVALQLDPALSHGPAPWENLVIEGDNFDALRALRMTHKGAIRCIYIDPPYNTGNNDFIYNDKFVDRTHRFRHSLWVDFMYRRMALAKELLSDDGLILVSINDHEMYRLGMLMDRVFGEAAKVACFVWQTDGNFDNQAKVKVCHEYILAYAPNPNSLPMPKLIDPNVPDVSKLFRPEIRNTIVKNGPKNPVTELRIPVGFPASFESGVVAARNNKWPHINDDIHVDNGAVQNEVILRSGWANRELCQEFINSGFQPILDTKKQSTTFVLTANGAIENVKKRDAPSHVLSVLRNMGNTQSDGAMLEDMGIGFTYPKPVTLMTYLLAILDDKKATFLDFFAGSGTTGHAISVLNAGDGGERKFILVSSTEATEDEPAKNICRDVCALRLRRVFGGYKNLKGDNVSGIGGSFAYLRARRVRRHRLASKLDHADVWNALQLMHGAALSPYSGEGFVADDESSLGYLADFRDASVDALKDWVARKTPNAKVYTWAPDRVSELAKDVELLPIPNSLRERFGN